MQLLAIAGGAGIGDEGALACCGVFVVLPLVALLVGRAVYRTSAWSAWAALLLAGLPYLLLRAMIAAYRPSGDWEVTDEQAHGRNVAAYYAWLVLVAASSLTYVMCRRLGRRSGLAQQHTPRPTPPHDAIP